MIDPLQGKTSAHALATLPLWSAHSLLIDPNMNTLSALPYAVPPGGVRSARLCPNSATSHHFVSLL